jgi:hypothetical protein
MILYDLTDYRLRDFGEVIEFYASREEAEKALSDVLRDEPAWQGELGVVPVSLRSRCSSSAQRA